MITLDTYIYLHIWKNQTCKFLQTIIDYSLHQEQSKHGLFKGISFSQRAYSFL